MQEITNGQAGFNETFISEGYFPINELAIKYGYAKDHIGWLARTGRILAVRSGKHGRWYGNENSLLNYRHSLIEKFKKSARFSDGLFNEFQTLQTNNSAVLSFAPYKNSCSAKLVPVERSGQLRRPNAIPKLPLLFVGGILFLVMNLDLRWMGKSEIIFKKDTYANIPHNFKTFETLFSKDGVGSESISDNQEEVLRRRIEMLEQKLAQQQKILEDNFKKIETKTD